MEAKAEAVDGTLQEAEAKEKLAAVASLILGLILDKLGTFLVLFNSFFVSLGVSF